VLTAGETISLIVALIALAGVAVQVIVNYVGRRRDADDTDRRERTPDYAELLGEVRQLRAETGKLSGDFSRHRLATGNVLSDAERQWPPGNSTPVFDPSDLEILGDVVPRRWRRPRRNTPAPA
jgi:hypothetical protein